MAVFSTASRTSASAHLVVGGRGGGGGGGGGRGRVKTLDLEGSAEQRPEQPQERLVSHRRVLDDVSNDFSSLDKERHGWSKQVPGKVQAHFVPVENGDVVCRSLRRARWRLSLRARERCGAGGRPDLGLRR